MMKFAQLVLLLAVMSLSACGFHLRGSDMKDITFSFKSLYLKAPGNTDFVQDLRRTLKANKILLTATADEADLVLEVVSEQSLKQILSLDSSGHVQEYKLLYNVSLRAYDKQQIDWLPVEEISLSRNMTYDSTQIYAMDQQEATLYKDMRSDAVMQAIRRLYRAKPHPDLQ
jgi:LPS-assembly lipoprotein